MNSGKLFKIAFPFPIPLATLFLTGLLALSACKPDSGDKVQYKYQDNTVRLRLAGEPDRLNPWIARNAYSRMVFERIFPYLMDFDPVTLQLTPFLAKAQPEVNTIESGPYAGGLSLTMEIRPEAVWDNGQPVTARDIEFSLKIALAPGVPTPYRSYLDFFYDFQIDSTNERRFTLFAKEKYILLEAVAASIPAYPRYIFDPDGLLDSYTLKAMVDPANQAKLEQDGVLKQFVEQYLQPLFSSEPAGVISCGPYKLDRWEQGQYLLLSKKPDWWGKGLAKVSQLFAAEPDTLLFKVIPDMVAAANAIKDQELDFANNLDSKDFVDFKENSLVTDYYKLESPVSPTIYLMYLNNKDPKLADKRVRRALAHLMDVDEFISSLYYGLANRVNGPILPTKAYYNQDLPLIPFDVEKAQSLLAEAGWKDANNDGVLEKEMDGKVQDLELDILVSNAAIASENMALFLQDNARKAGVKVTVTKKEFRELMSENVRKKNYQIYPGAMSLDLTLDDPKQQWHTESDQPGGGNYTGFGSLETDALIDSIRVTLDESRRNQLYKELQKAIYDETPAIFLFVPLERMVIHKRFDMKTSEKRPGFFPNTFKLNQ